MGLNRSPTKENSSTKPAENTTTPRQTTLNEFMAVNASEDTNLSWQKVTRKRPATTPPETLRWKTTIPPKSTVSTSNRFNILDSQDTNTDSTQTTTHDTQAKTGVRQTAQAPKATRPPPIFIHGVESFSGMVKTLTQFVKKEQLTFSALANNVVRVNLTSADDYRLLVRELRKINISFHTYQMKSERALKVVIRHLHSSTTTEEIKEALEELGFACRNVVNIRHWQTKTPLPLFFVDIEPDEHANEIYKVSTLLQSRIKIESPRPKRTVAQCHRCQQLGHTKTYCTLPPVCVKCGEEHTWNSCQKPSDVKPTCGLCQGDHPANYRGCPSHKKFTLSRRTAKPNLNDKTEYTNPTRTVEHNRTQVSSGQQKTYAQAANPVPPSATEEHERIQGLTVNNTNIVACFKRLEQLMADLIRQNGMILELLMRNHPK